MARHSARVLRLEGPIDLAGSLRGGQAFRWREDGAGGFRATVGRHLVRYQRAPGDGAVLAEATPEAGEAFHRSYFRLEPEDAARRARLARDPVLAPALAAHPGLRLLRQDPWETTVAFLTSANNNVPRIEGILQALTAKYGEPLPDARAHRAFPTPERLARAREDALRACGLGYRAPFLRESAAMIARGEVDLRALRGLGADRAREALLALPGVGPKVADCISLFSLDCDDAFPIDRWVLRAMSKTFFGGREVAPPEAAALARARWGADAGLAQQYLFHVVRMGANAPGTRRA